MTSSAWWAHTGVPWFHTWWLILSSHSFWSLSIGESVMGSLVVTRSCRALGAEKLPKATFYSGGCDIYIYMVGRRGKRSPEWQWLKDKEGKSPQK